MAHEQDSHDTKTGGFWSCATLFLGLGFSAFAATAGIVLIYGGLKAKPVATAPAAPAAPAPTEAVLAITLKPGAANPMSFDTTTINAKAGQKVKLTFQNQHPTAPLQHNLILCKPGTKDTMVAAANAMMTDMPKWLAKGFIPESPDVLHHTKLLNPGETETIEFTAGAKGDYPYLCTFPGHSLIMQGTLKVE